MRISDWSSDVCSSDLSYDRAGIGDSRSTAALTPAGLSQQLSALLASLDIGQPVVVAGHSYGGLLAALHAAQAPAMVRAIVQIDPTPEFDNETIDAAMRILPLSGRFLQLCALLRIDGRSEEHTSELQSLMRISYAVFCLKKKQI